MLILLFKSKELSVLLLQIVSDSHVLRFAWFTSSWECQTWFWIHENRAVQENTP